MKTNNYDSLKKLAGTEKVDHPSHYNREDAMECIDEMILIFGKEAVKNFCLCNVWKYRYRAADKNGKIDLEKSDWYMKKYQELCEEKGCSCKKKKSGNNGDSFYVDYPFYPDIWKDTVRTEYLNCNEKCASDKKR